MQGFKKHKRSRRAFLAGTGALGLATRFQLNPITQGLVRAGLAHAGEEIPVPGSGEWVPTVCQGCTIWCMKEAYVQDGRICHVRGNQHSRITGKSGCVHQSMALTELYDPDRVLEVCNYEARGELAFIPHYENPVRKGSESEYPMLFIDAKHKLNREGRGCNHYWYAGERDVEPGDLLPWPLG